VPGFILSGAPRFHHSRTKLGTRVMPDPGFLHEFDNARLTSTCDVESVATNFRSGSDSGPRTPGHLLRLGKTGDVTTEL
jgi:hypothetical protein